MGVSSSWVVIAADVVFVRTFEKFLLEKIDAGADRQLGFRKKWSTSLTFAAGTMVRPAETDRCHRCTPPVRWYWKIRLSLRY